MKRFKPYSWFYLKINEFLNFVNRYIVSVRKPQMGKCSIQSEHCKSVNIFKTYCRSDCEHMLQFISDLIKI